MILVCAVDYFRKYLEDVENSFFKKNHKKSFISNNSGVWCFSSRLDGFEITFTSIRKNELKTLIFFKYLFDFAFLSPKIGK